MTVISVLDQGTPPYTALRGEPRVLVVHAPAFPEALWPSPPSPCGFPLALRSPPRDPSYPCAQGRLSSPAPAPSALLLAHMHCARLRLSEPPRARALGH